MVEHALVEHLHDELARPIVSLALPRSTALRCHPRARSGNPRRGCGAGAGLDELSLATVSLAVARGALATAESASAGALAELRARTGLPPAAPIDLRGELVDDAAVPPLEALVERLGRRADVRRASRSAEASAHDARLQERLGIPPLRLGLSGGRENEYYDRVGLDWALPIVQRNQTAVAAARAGIRAAQIERDALRAQAEMELRAAHATYERALDAWRVLRDALPGAAR